MHHSLVYALLFVIWHSWYQDFRKPIIITAAVLKDFVGLPVNLDKCRKWLVKLVLYIIDEID